ncbi:hypothetical protein FQR65_LT10858 [Abscondita terminalis]|nr:hypothetical protein FQR65_LT10858 [Abscondita terminalis]
MVIEREHVTIFNRIWSCIRQDFDSYSSPTFATAVCQFIFSCILCFALFVVYRVVDLPSSTLTDKDIFISDYQEYLVLASAISFLFPTTFALALAIGIIKENVYVCWTCLISACIYFPCMTVGLVGSGIYLVMNKALEVGISAIVLGLIVVCFAAYSILINCRYNIKTLPRRMKTSNAKRSQNSTLA